MPDTIVSSSVESQWGEIAFPALSNSVYQYLGYKGYEYSLSVGIFSYDTSALEAALGSEAFGVWLDVYDGWSIGANLYFRYYGFENSESFGACIEG